MWISKLRASPLLEREAGPKVLERWSFHYDPCADPAAGAAADFWPATALFGAPVNPAAAPMPSISSQRGQGCEALPFRARSITSRERQGFASLAALGRDAWHRCSRG